MRHRLLLSGVLTLLLMLGAVPGALADFVVNFDDLATPQVQDGMHWDFIPTTYGPIGHELQWSELGQDPWEVGNGPDYKLVYGNTCTLPTSPNFAYNGTGLMVCTVSGAPFDFLGASFSTWAMNNAFAGFSSTFVEVSGYNHTVLVGTEHWDLTTNFVEKTTNNLNNVTRLTFSNDGQYQHWWLMDNFTFTPSDGQGGTETVPEPAALGLLGLGLLAIRRRRT